jgi:hypothetical protein
MMSHASNMAELALMTKKANNQLNFNNAASGALTGGLIGAGTMGAIDLLKGRKDRALRSALMGGALGSLAGGGAGHLRNIGHGSIMQGGYQAIDNMMANPTAEIRNPHGTVRLNEFQPAARGEAEPITATRAGIESLGPASLYTAGSILKDAPGAAATRVGRASNWMRGLSAGYAGVDGAKQVYDLATTDPAKGSIIDTYGKNPLKWKW